MTSNSHPSALDSKHGPIPVHESFQITVDMGFRGPKAMILSSYLSDTAFYVNCRAGSHNDFTIHNGPNTNGPLVGRIQFHNFHSHADLQFGDGGPGSAATELSTELSWTRRHSVALPSTAAMGGFGGGMLHWKTTKDFGFSSWRGGHLKLVDEADKCFAVFERTSSRDKDGRLFITVKTDAKLLIEIVTCSVAAIEKERRNRNNAAASSGAATSAATAAAAAA